MLVDTRGTKQHRQKVKPQDRYAAPPCQVSSRPAYAVAVRNRPGVTPISRRKMEVSGSGRRTQPLVQSGRGADGSGTSRLDPASGVHYRSAQDRRYGRPNGRLLGRRGQDRRGDGAGQPDRDPFRSKGSLQLRGRRRLWLRPAFDKAGCTQSIDGWKAIQAKYINK